MLKKYTLLLGFFIASYTVITFYTSPDPATLKNFSLTTLQLHFITFTLLLPLALVWFLAFYGFAKFKEYALKIIATPDGHAFNTLADGLMVLALMLPTSSLISAIFNFFTTTYPDFTAATVITNRYISLGLAAVAFVLIYKGSKKLAALTERPTGYRYLWSGIPAIIIGVLYIYLVLANSALDSSAGKAVYYLPVWLIITTIIIPYTYIWYLGLRSAFFILFYKRNVQGSVYRQALGSLAAGVGMVVGASIVVQLLTTISNHLVSWGLQSVLGLFFVLLVIIAAGYILIALGAKKLKKIEDV